MSRTSKTTKVLGLSATAAIALTMMSSAGASAAGGTAADRAVNHVAGKNTSTGPRSLRVVETAATHSECTFHSYAPNKIVLGASPVKRTFSVNVTDCEVAGWGIALGPFVNAAQTTGIASTSKPKISLNPRMLSNADAGKHAQAAVAVFGMNDDLSDDNLVPAGGDALGLTLLRASTFGKSLNASEPVKKGKSITIKGKLGRVNWNGAKTLKYVGFPKAKVKVQFMASGTTTWKTVKTVTAGTGGKVSTTVKATKSGSWKLAFAGVSTTASSTSNADAVKVTS